MSETTETQISSRSAKLIQILEDTIQILVDDYELMQDDDYEEPNEINAEEIIYDVIKVVEDCNDPEACLEMIVPVIGALQKYLINLAENANVFLIQLFLHLIQTCLTGIKGEFVLPKSIVKHITEVVIEKLPQDDSLLVERAFLLGALVLNCQQDDTQVMEYICQKFLTPKFQQDFSEDVIEALTGCLTDVSGTFKQDFRNQTELLNSILARISHNHSNKQDEALYNAMGDIALSGGLHLNYINQIFQVVQSRLQKNTDKSVRMALIQMHTCIFNSLSDNEEEFIKKIVPYIKQLIEFVFKGIETDNTMTKTQLKESLSLLLDIGVLYAKTDEFNELTKQIWNQKTQNHFKQLRKQLDEQDDYKTILYFDNVLQRIFKVDFQHL